MLHFVFKLYRKSNKQFPEIKLLYKNTEKIIELTTCLNIIKPAIQNRITPKKGFGYVVNFGQMTGDTVKFSKNTGRMICGKGININSTETNQEFKTILNELLQDSSYKWKSVEKAFDYERAILPYAGRGDISSDINSFLREGTLKKTTYADLTEEKIKKYIQALDYGLNQLDKEYGKYNGIVYRYGMFSSKTTNYISTSDKISCAINFAEPKNPCKEDYNIIFTKHGHKINKMQKRLGFKFAENESEILLDSGKSYIELTNESPELIELKENFYKEFNKIHPNCNPEDIKLKFWQEI